MCSKLAPASFRKTRPSSTTRSSRGPLPAPTPLEETARRAPTALRGTWLKASKCPLTLARFFPVPCEMYVVVCTPLADNAKTRRYDLPRRNDSEYKRGHPDEPVASGERGSQTRTWGCVDRNAQPPREHTGGRNPLLTTPLPWKNCDKWMLTLRPTNPSPG